MQYNLIWGQPETVSNYSDLKITPSSGSSRPRHSAAKKKTLNHRSTTILRDGQCILVVEEQSRSAANVIDEVLTEAPRQDAIAKISRKS